jgi:hypothetical protein
VDQEVARIKSRSELASASLVAVVASLVWALALLGQGPERSDATGDWILINTIERGISPFQDIHQLGAILGVPYHSVIENETLLPILHYRTPGALLLLTPLLVIPWQSAHVVYAVSGLVATLWLLLRAVPAACDRSVRQLLVPLLVISASVTWFEATLWGSSMAVVTALAMPLMTRPSSVRSAALSAIPASFKVFPGLALLPLLARKSTALTAGAGCLTFLCLQVLGSILLGVSFEASIDLIASGAEAWLDFGANFSLGAISARLVGHSWPVFVVVALAVLLAGAVAIKKPLSQAVAASLALGVLVNPVSWIAYDLLLIPVVMRLLVSRSRLAQISALIWLLVQALALPIGILGFTAWWPLGMLVARLLVAMSAAFVPSEAWEIRAGHDLSSVRSGRANAFRA